MPAKRKPLYLMNESQAGELIHAVQTIEKLLERQTADIATLTKDMNRRNTVLFDENVGAMKDFSAIASRLTEIETYITRQKAYIVMLGSLGAVVIAAAKWIGLKVLALLAH